MQDQRTPGISSVREIVPKSIHRCGTKVWKGYVAHRVLLHWPEIVGEDIARQVEAVRIMRQKLWLYTADSAWRNEIYFLQEEILQRVNNYAGEKLVGELLFARSGRERRALLSEEMPEADGQKQETLPFRQRVAQTNLTDEEIRAAREACANVADEALREKLFALTLKQKKLQRCKENAGYHKCADCGALCPKEETRCGVCRLRHGEKLRAQIMRLLSDVPWLSYAEIRERIPEATVRQVSLARAWLVGAWAAKVELKDYATVEAKLLVMLFRSLPPEKATEAVVKRALYEKPLRLYLKKPENWQPVRRRDYIPLGTSKET